MKKLLLDQNLSPTLINRLAIRIGNRTTESIVELLKANPQIIENFSEDKENGTLSFF